MRVTNKKAPKAACVLHKANRVFTLSSFTFSGLRHWFLTFQKRSKSSNAVTGVDSVLGCEDWRALLSILATEILVNCSVSHIMPLLCLKLSNSFSPHSEYQLLNGSSPQCPRNLLFRPLLFPTCSSPADLLITHHLAHSLPSRHTDLYLVPLTDQTQFSPGAFTLVTRLENSSP